jgi:hypothetical protein
MSSRQTQTSAYIGASSCLRLVVDESTAKENMNIDFTKYETLFNKRSFLVTFVVCLFSESKKRRLGEGCDGLTLEAAKKTFDMLKTDIVGFQQSIGQVYWTVENYDELAAAFARYAKASNLYRVTVTEWLRDYRSELFDVTQFRTAIEHYGETHPEFNFYEEHPMQTFRKALDLIEFQKRRDNDTFLLKLNLTNLARVGNAMLERAEWDGNLIARVPRIAAKAHR